MDECFSHSMEKNPVKCALFLTSGSLMASLLKTLNDCWGSIKTSLVWAKQNFAPVYIYSQYLAKLKKETEPPGGTFRVRAMLD